MPYETEIIKSSDMFVDESEIVTKGVDGEKLASTPRNMLTASLPETVFSRETVIKQPVKEVKKSRHEAQRSALGL